MKYIETNILNEHGYDFELTGDLSPTLRILQKESMHIRNA